MDNLNDLNDLPARPQPMRPAFAKELRARLNSMNANEQTRSHPLVAHWRLALSGAMVAAIAVLFVLSPVARATAESLLGLFRVKRITAIAIDPARIEQLREKGITTADIESLIGDAMVEDEAQVRQAGEPVAVADAATAGQAAGISIRSINAAAFGLPEPQAFVQGAQTVHFRGNLLRMNSFMQVFGINDVTLPAQLDGSVVTLTKPAAVMLKYGDELTLMQSRSPEVELPDGVNIAQLGEIALRLAGLPADEASRVAQMTDWNSTLLVPIPANAASFREVTLNNGATALLVTTNGTGATSMRGRDGERQHSSLVWTEGDMVYGLSGGFTGDVVNVANALQ